MMEGNSKVIKLGSEEAGVPYPKLTSMMMGHDAQPRPQMITPYQCETCGKYFTQKPGLKKHIRIHTGERPYKCPICNRGFTQSSSCKIHLRTHTGEKPHKCHICGRCFPHSSTLVNHIRGHTGEKCYKCQWCGRAFTCRNYLRTHIRVHTGERPYKCVDCGKAFSQLSNLMQHNRDIHTKEKRFKCEICDRAFGRLETLQCHLRTHMGHERFKCGVCQSTFSQKNLLRMHYKTHFGDLLSPEQEKILLETSELFDENNIPSAMDSSNEGAMRSDEAMQIPKITNTTSLSPFKQTPLNSPVSTLLNSTSMSCSPPEQIPSSVDAAITSIRNSGVETSLLQSPRTFIPRKLLTPVEHLCPRRSGLSCLLNPRDLEETLSGVYVVGGAAITCNLLIWTIATFHTLRNCHLLKDDVGCPDSFNTC